MNAIEQIIINSALIGDTETTGRVERFDAMLPELLKIVPGNIVEIGAGVGQSTKIFLKHAKDFGRKVLVIDPFESGWGDMPESYGKPYPFEEFKENTSGYDNELILLMDSSIDMHNKVFSWYKCNSPMLVFVDGLQSKDATLNDIHLASNANTQIICLDDIHRITEHCQVPEALEEFLKHNNNYKLITLPRKNIEGYLIRI